MVLKRLWRTNRGEDPRSKLQEMRQYPGKVCTQFSRGGRGEISSGVRSQTVCNLVALVRDTHFTVVPYVAMPTKMHQNRNISEVMPLFSFKEKSAFYILIHNSTLSKPPSIVMQ